MNPFGDAYQEYRSKGWTSPFPLPAGKKFPPPLDRTGYDADIPSSADLHAWSEDGPRNIGLHLCGDVIGLDVDDHDHDTLAFHGEGSELLAKMEIDNGPLPATWHSSRQGPGPWGIYLFRLPAGVISDAMRDPHGKIEVIRHGHRYMVVAPSVTNGTTYCWYDADGLPSEIPARGDLPELPLSWCSALGFDAENPEARPATGAKVSEDVAGLMLTARPATIPFDPEPFAQSKTIVEAAAFIARRRHEYISDPDYDTALWKLAMAYGRILPHAIDLKTAMDGIREAVESAREPGHLESCWICARQARKGLCRGMSDPTQIMTPKGAPPGVPLSSRHDTSAPTPPPPTPASTVFVTEELHARLVTEAPRASLDVENPDWVRHMMAEIPRLPFEFYARPETDNPELRGSWELAHIYAAARAARVSPEGMLCSHLCEVVTAMPPNVVLPPEEGSRTPASLNLFVGLVAASGGGKNKCRDEARQSVLVRHQQYIEAAAMDPVMGITTRTLADNGVVYSKKPKTAEGINAMFRGRTGGKEPKLFIHRHSVWLTVGEITSFTAISSGSSDPTGTLCEAWSGAALDERPKDNGRYLPLDYMNYRLCMTIGIQPTEVEEFLAKGGVGLPQRPVYMPGFPLLEDATVYPTSEEGMASYAARIAAFPRPGQRTWTHPPVPAVDTENYSYGGECGAYTLAPMKVDPAVQFAAMNINSEIIAGERDELDAHAALVRLKLAAAFAIMHGRCEVTIWDWTKALEMMDVSDATRECMRRVLRAKAALKSDQSRKAKVADQIAVRTAEDDLVDTKARSRVLRSFSARLKTAGSVGITWSELKGNYKDSPSSLTVAHSVLESLGALGQVRVESIDRGIDAETQQPREPGERWFWINTDSNAFA